MPRGYIRVCEPGNRPSSEKAYLFRGRQYPIAKAEFLAKGGKQFSSRPAADLDDIEPEDLRIKNVAIAPDKSVSFIGSLPDEPYWSLWTRSALIQAWGRNRANKFLNFHLKRAGAKALPKSLTDPNRKKKKRVDDDSDSDWLDAVRSKEKRRERKSRSRESTAA
jgi:hypothetical protein